MEGLMTQTAKMLSRRSVTTGLTATVMAIPAIGLVTSATGDPSDGPLLEAIGRYQAEIAAVNASHGLTDDELDAWVDRADAILMEAVGLPVLTAASAVAVISLHVDEPILAQHSVYGNEFSTLVRAARDYIASTAKEPAA
jgi:hypothetical protein